MHLPVHRPACAARRGDLNRLKDWPKDHCSFAPNRFSKDLVNLVGLASQAAEILNPEALTRLPSCLVHFAAKQGTIRKPACWFFSLYRALSLRKTHS